jgi:uncharacterized protein (DUF4415 family)
MRKLTTAHLSGKTRITMFLDDAVLDHFRRLARRTGGKYQTLINEALVGTMKPASRPVTTAELRRVLREELALRR